MLRIGILGAARIAAKFVAGVAGSPKVQVVAIASRDEARAQTFARAHHVARTCATYEALLDSKDIDAIYNPLPNGLHAEWSIRAMDAGKHVLCEKPLAGSVAEASAMFAASRRNGVRLVEAYPYRSQPQTLVLQRLLADGAIGRVRTIHAAFGFMLTAQNDIRLDPALAGGALMDLGSYPLSLIRMISGEAPASVHAIGVMHPSGVDRSAAATLAFANGIIAQAACSFDTALYRQALIAGDDGVIETSYANHTGNESPPVLLIRRGRDRQGAPDVMRVTGINGFRAEADAFADHVAGGPWTGISEAESLDVAAMLDSLRAMVAANARSR